jgi:hypothetical protein
MHYGCYPPGMPTTGTPGLHTPGIDPGQMMMPDTQQLEQRVTRMEHQLRRLEARVSRLETPFPDTTAPFPGQFQTTHPFETHEGIYSPSMHTVQ